MQAALLVWPSSAASRLAAAWARLVMRAIGPQSPASCTTSSTRAIGGSASASSVSPTGSVLHMAGRTDAIGCRLWLLPVVGLDDSGNKIAAHDIGGGEANGGDTAHAI